ncbi:hypothetical protein B7494_g4705 [Chlorociboria aeruginascens]|nr:hypothetical protein B7494_g4705 [Chlorociboria aeruginascens]
MADYKNYLAGAILTEDRVITYRLLSRALKVNVNSAKEMLFEFHRLQNGKKPGTIHATYLISGTKREEEPVTSGDTKKDGEDEYMQSSPFVENSGEGTGESSVLTITLVREENLDDIRSQYEHITSIHVYSIGPHPLKDLQVLSNATREIQELTAAEDSLEMGPIYGTILNKDVKRRSARRPIPQSAPAAVPVKPAAAKSNLNTVTEAPQSSTTTTNSKAEPKAPQPSSAKDFFGKGKEKSRPAANNDESSRETTPNPPAMKRKDSSIFKAFAKAKPRKQAEDTESSARDSPAIEDSPMKDVSDDEEDTFVPEAQPASTEIVDSNRKARQEREAALKKMMDDEEDDGLAPTPDIQEVEAEDPEPKSKSGAIEPKEEPAVVGDGRRRGRRRIQKKKTVKDEEGYLVTKLEEAWESFSEDEPVARPKSRVQVSSTTAKPKKTASKAGQGSIMSFFGKK